jgi:hypothetical protein
MDAFCKLHVNLLKGAAEQAMKIYLLMALIGIILTAVHFTSTPDHGSETLPQ